MITMEKLKEFGVDPQEGLARCLNNEGFYLKLVQTVPGEAGFDALKAAIEANDLDKAFEAAHGLKGVLGNLSIGPLYDPVVEITELLRSKTDMDYSDLLGQIMEKRDEMKALCE